MTCGRDPQCFVLDHLKLVQMRGYLGEPDGVGIVKDGWGTWWPYTWPPEFRSWSPNSTQQGFSWHWGPSRPARHSRGDEGRRWSGCPAWHPEFRGPVQQSHCVADSHLRFESGLVSIGCEKGHAGFLGGQWPAAYQCIGSPHQNGAQLVGPCLSLHNAGSRGQQSEVVGLGRHV